jgi:hypothetical protein
VSIVSRLGSQRASVGIDLWNNTMCEEIADILDVDRNYCTAANSFSKYCKTSLGSALDCTSLCGASRVRDRTVRTVGLETPRSLLHRAPCAVKRGLLRFTEALCHISSKL